jgi:Flp pilus assembly protein TadG
MRSAMTTQRMRFRKVCLVNFTRDESGSLTPFTMMMFFLMLLIGGLAVDVMRHERTRVRLQQTLDNSVLAAAARSQTLDPEHVVEDYFDKAGLSEYLMSVTVEQGLNFRSVFADAKADTRPFFMSLMGINEFYVNADSAAEEKISNVEVSLVLDVSGSMDGSRINTLRPAARNFVDTILQNSEAGKASISIVPFSTQVNAGANVMAQYNAPRISGQNYNSCVEFPASSYTSVELPTSLAMNHNGHFDPFNNDSDLTTPSTFNCVYTNSSSASNITARSTANQMLVLSGNATALKNKINALHVGGNTSVEIGVKWGSALLDPGTRSVTTALVGTGDVAATFDTRPLDYDPQETIKVLVVMSDGANTTEYRLKPAYRTGNSNVWRKSDGTLYAYHDRASTTSDYYNVSTGKWSTKPSSVTNLTWQTVFQTYTAYSAAYNFFARPLGQSGGTAFGNMVESIGNGTKNTRLSQACSAAKANGIVVFSISFQAGTGAAPLAGCATDANHFFEGDPTTIGSIFQTIANQISYLRLTL